MYSTPLQFFQLVLFYSQDQILFSYCFQEIVDTFEREVKNKNNEFVEGIMFDTDRGVVMRGEFSDEPEFWKVNLS